MRQTAESKTSFDLVMQLSLLGVAVALLAFLILANDVSDGETHPLDTQLLQTFRHPDDPQRLIGPPWLEQAVIDISALGGYAVLILVTFTVLGYLLLCRDYRTALLVFVAAAGGLLLSYGLKAYFARNRPEVVPHLLHLNSASFPSGHAQLSTVIYLTLGGVVARLVPGMQRKCYLLGTAVMLALLVGVSRVVLGVHYPTDVVAGWAVGLAWALICWLVARSLQRHHLIAEIGAEDDATDDGQATPPVTKPGA